ncbi:Thioesterase domain [Sesbania bispinosa]|nr:Thioesterase domain [Sesbania bispinosa]
MVVKADPAAQTEIPSSSSSTRSFSDQMDPQHVSYTLTFLNKMGLAKPIPQSCNTSGFYSNFFGNFIKNAFGTLHGGSVGSLIELLSTGCARTVVAEDKELFLGEISVSYLSGAPTNAEVLADASVVKSGRNVTMVALEFKLKKTGNLIYIAHATFYNLPVAKL